MDRQKKQRKPLFATILLVLLGLLILLSTTYAWRDLSQHKTNLWGKRRNSATRNVTLNDKHNPVSGWQEGEEINKELSVTNLSDSGGLACVRLSLKEFLQLQALPDSDNFIKDERGNEILFATYARGSRKGEFLTYEESVRLGLHYGKFPVMIGVDPKTKEKIMVDYATTVVEEEQNGIYGKRRPIPGDVLQVWGNAPRANFNHSLQLTEECDYDPYLWDGLGSQAAFPLDNPDPHNIIRHYIELGTADVISLDSWYAAGRGLGNFWIVDEDDGWVYWGNHLIPGASTTNLLNTVTLIQHPQNEPDNHDGDSMQDAIMDYYIHVDLNATDETENEIVGVFGDATDETGNPIITLEDLRNAMNTDVLPDYSKAKYALLELFALNTQD